MKRKLLVNTLVSGGHTVIVGLVGLALLPFMLLRLGVLELGLIGIINIFAMSGYIGVFELGLQSSISKYVSEFAATKAYDKIAALVNSTLAVLLAIGAVLAVLGILLSGPVTEYLFRIPRDHHESFALALQLMFGSYVFLFPAIAIQGLLEGLQRFAVLKAIQVVVVLLNAAGTVVLLLLGHRYFALVGLLIALHVLQFAAMLVYALFTVPSLRLGVSLFSRESLKEIRRMTGFLFAGRISSLLFNNTDRLLIASLLGGVAMGYYDIVIKIPRLLKSVLGFINAAVMPAVSELVAQDRKDVVRRLLLFGTNVHMMVSYPLVTGVMFYAEPLLAAWIGDEYVHLALLLRWALGFNLLVALIGIGGSIVVGSNKALRSFTAVGFAASVVNVSLSIALIGTHGLQGVFMATVVATALMLPLYVKTFMRVAPVGHRAFWGQVLKVGLAGLAPFAIATAAAQWFTPGSVVQVVAAVGGWALLYWTTLYLTVGGHDERDAFRAILSLVRRPSTDGQPAGIRNS